MNCPKCGELIFDVYTDEKRIRDLYNTNSTTNWAKSELKILTEISNPSVQWLQKKILEIVNKMEIVRV
jgi:hypothetical protein